LDQSIGLWGGYSYGGKLLNLETVAKVTYLPKTDPQVKLERWIVGLPQAQIIGVMRNAGGDSLPEWCIFCPDLKLIKPLKIQPIQIIPLLSEEKNPFSPSPMFAAFSPWHPKYSSPQKPWKDMKIISAPFAGSVIREGFGKLTARARRGRSSSFDIPILSGLDGCQEVMAACDPIKLS